MSQSDPMPNPNLNCRECGATNYPDASECWLCQRRDWRGPPRFSTSPKPEPSSDSGHGPALIGLTLALGLVALGALAMVPGLAIGLLILVVPPWIGAEMIANRRRNRGLPTSATRKVAWILVLTILIPILLGVALFIAFWMICLVAGPPNFH